MGSEALPAATVPLTQEPLGVRVKNGLGWSLANNLVGRLAGMAFSIALARILAPDDYGVFAVALVALNALLSVNELGVSLAVVRWPGDVTRIAPTVASISLACSFVLYFACFLAAPIAAEAMAAPQAAPLLRVLALSVFIDAATAVPAGLLRREFQQGRQMAADLTGLLGNAAVAIPLALMGHGPWSLVWGMLAGNVLAGATVLRLAPSIRPGFDIQQARELLRFGLPLAGSSLLVFGMLNIDYVVAGRFLGPTQLGLYLLAFNVSSLPVNVLSAAVRRVSLSYFSRLSEAHSAPGAPFARALGLLMAVTVPVCVLLGVFAVPLVAVVYGDRWSDAAPVLASLMLLSCLRVALELAYDFLVALGKTRTVAVLQAIWFATLVPALIVGATWGGIRGIALMHAIVAGGVVLPAFAYALVRSGVRLTHAATWCARPAVGGVAMLLVGLLSQRWLSGDLETVLVGGGSAGLVYLVLLWPFVRRVRGSFGGTIPSEPSPLPAAVG